MFYTYVIKSKKSGMGKRYLKNRMKRFLSVTGFSLVELLIVSSLVAIIGLALYSAFNNGILIWQKVNQGLAAEDAGIFFDKITHDLKNSFNFASIKATGTDISITFPTLIKFKDKEGAKDGIGQVSYFFDKKNELLCRRQSNYSEIYQGRGYNDQDSVKNVTRLKFQYYYYDSKLNEFSWRETWEDDGFFKEEEKEETRQPMPLAVKIELEVKDGDYRQKFTDIIAIPIAHFKRDTYAPSAL